MKGFISIAKCDVIVVSGIVEAMNRQSQVDDSVLGRIVANDSLGMNQAYIPG